MMISQDITDLINQAKDLPNGESKNRMVSHLKDAYAHAVLLERDDFMKDKLGKGGLVKGDTMVTGSSIDCNCPAPGVITVSPKGTDSICHCPDPTMNVVAKSSEIDIVGMIAGGCSCPEPGVISKSCPIHGIR